MQLMAIFSDITEECVKQRHSYSTAKIRPILRDNLETCEMIYQFTDMRSHTGFPLVPITPFRSLKVTDSGTR